MTYEHDGETLVAEPKSSAVILSLGLGAVGFALLGFAPRVTAWALSLPWVPFGGPLRVLQELGSTIPWWALGLAGLALGAALGLILYAAEPVISVSDRAIVITRGDHRTRVARSQVLTATIEDKHLVLRDQHDVELAYEKLDSGRQARVAEALDRHRWR